MGKKKEHQQKSGNTAMWLRAIGVSGIAKFFAIIGGISLGYREFGFFASGVYNGITEIFLLNMVLYF